MDRQRSTLARAIDYFVEHRRWGYVAVHFTDGHPRNVETCETYQPDNQPYLASAVESHPAVLAALSSGETTEFVFAKVKGGELSLLSVKSHRKEEYPHASDEQQPRSAPGPAAFRDPQRGP